MTTKVLVWDFFGVICSEVAPHWLATYLPRDRALAVKEQVVGSADRGDISQTEMFSALSNMTGIAPDTIERCWISLAVLDTAVVKIVRDAHQRYRSALLTNSPSPFVRGLLANSRLNDLFEVIVVSSEVHRAKPDPGIYDILLTKLRVPPAQAFLIDDNPSNVAGAIRVGMGAVLFESASQLAKELVRLV